MFSASTFLEQIRFDLDQAKSINELNNVVRGISAHSSLKHVLYHLARPPGVVSDAITLRTCATEWIKDYYAKNDEYIDPEAIIPRTAILPVDWSEAPRLKSALRRVFGVTRDGAVGRCGMTIPLRGHFGESALFSFTFDGNDQEWGELKRRRLSTLRVAAFLLHDRVLDLTIGSGEALRPRLSVSELDCLTCLANGMTPEATARRLGMSRPIVETYLESARYKLGAPTTDSLVDRAGRFGIIAKLTLEV